MSKNRRIKHDTQENQVTRRELMASGAVVAAAAFSLAGNDAGAGTYKSKKPAGNPPKPPFDSMRAYVEAL